MHGSYEICTNVQVISFRSSEFSSAARGWIFLFAFGGWDSLFASAVPRVLGPSGPRPRPGASPHLPSGGVPMGTLDAFPPAPQQPGNELDVVGVGECQKICAPPAAPMRL